jgi:hypothetical protein
VLDQDVNHGIVDQSNTEPEERGLKCHIDSARGQVSSGR